MTHSFSESTYEIDEASKCIALNRTTAAVFHLMRIMELGIKAISRCLGIPDPSKPTEKNWGLMLNKIKTAIDLKNGKLSEDDQVFFKDAYASLDAVKNAWRNSTMHIENKYTDEEAEHIFIVVKEFMKKVSLRMDQDGNPQA